MCGVWHTCAGFQFRDNIICSQVYKEISEVLGNDLTSCPTQEDLMKLTYLDRVLKESLRMCPAVPITARKITEDLKVTTKDGQEYELPAGNIVNVCNH